MRVGVAADHGGYTLKQELVSELRAAGYVVVDFGAYEFHNYDDYPDFVVPLARASLIHDHFSARQGSRTIT